MNQPSREAMAGKLQIYADGVSAWSAASLAAPTEPRSGEIFIA